MGTGYTRNDSTNNIANGNVINASDLDGEFDAIQTAFSTSGHTHDGTAAEGGVITVVGPAQEFIGDGTAWYPKTDATYDLGKSTASFDVAFVESINLAGTVITSSASEINKLDGVTASTAELNFVDGVTSNIQTQLNTKLPKAGGTMTGDVLYGDSVKAKFGAGSDLWIYSDGTDSYIEERNGTGSLYIDATDLQLRSTANAKYFRGITGGAVDLYYNNASKLATTSTGISVTGNVVVSGTVDGRDVATDGTKLDGIEANAKNDQTITAGSGLSGGGTGNVTLSHSDTSSQASSNNSGRTYIQDITLDTYGHVTGLNTATETVTNTNTNQLTTFVMEDGDGTEVTISHGKEMKFVEGQDIDVNWTDTSTGSDGDPYDLTISHKDTSTLSGTYGSTANGTKIDNITVDGRGHVTAITTGACGDIEGVTAGSGLTGGGSSGTVTLSHSDTSSQASSNNSGRTYIQDITLDTYGHVTGLATASESVVNTNLTHTGEVTGGQSLTIANNVVDEANLKVSNSPTNGYVLSAESGNTGGLTWIEAGGAGAVGGGNDEVFFENGQTVTSNYTITNGKNAMSAGPITINSGVTVTVGAGETWTVI